jgi:hypothetical protein
MARNGGKKNGRLADMSLPPNLRIVKRKGKKIGNAATAQMSHNSGNRRKGKKS